MKKFTKLVSSLFFGSLLTGSLGLYAQNPYWVFPPNYIDMRLGSIGTLPGTPPTRTAGSQNLSANGLFDPNGALRFFAAESVIKDQFGNSANLNGKYAHETLIIPVPNVANNYYVLSTELISGGFIPGAKRLVQSKVTYNPANSTFTKQSETSIVDFSGDIGLAYHPDHGLLVAGKSLVTTNFHSDVLKKFTVNELGIYPYATDNNIVSASNLNTFSTQELDISPNGLFTAWGSNSSGFIYLVSLASTAYPRVAIPITGASSGITGVEFSADSKKLFFSKKSGGVGFIDLSSQNVASAAVSSYVIPNTTDLANSQLELASDGRIYGSNGTTLNGFNPSITSPIIEMTFTIANPAGATGVYYLPDQVDGRDHLNNLSLYNALRFDGYNSFLKIPTYADVNNLSTGDFTIEAKFNAKSSNSPYPSIWSNRNSSGNGLMLFLNGTKPAINIQNGNYNCSNCPTVTDNLCHSISVTRTGGYINFYLDGVFKQAVGISPTATIATGIDMMIGKDFTSQINTKFKGEISEVRLWNSARTPFEIDLYKNKSVKAPEFGLVGYWKLNEGQGQTIYNSATPGLNSGFLGGYSTIDGMDPSWTSGCVGVPTGPKGSTFENPIVLSGTSSTYTHNNSASNGFGDEYGQTSEDIVYSFTIGSNSFITASTCNSAIGDTYLSLFRADRSLVQDNDDNGYSSNPSDGQLCSANLHSSIKLNLLPGTYYLVSEGYSLNYIGDITTSLSIQPYNASYGVSRREAEKESLPELDKASEVLAYPNPIKGGILKFGKTVGTYRLTDNTGAQIVSGTNADELNAESLTAGMYILTTDGKVQKIVVLK